MPRGRIFRYACGLAALLGGLGALVACGADGAGLAGAPTEAATPGHAVTAPAGTVTTALAPVLVPGPEPAAATTASSAQPPPVVQAPIPYPQARLQEMAAYSLRHYGSASWRLTPSVIVLHYTDGPTAEGARSAFAADTVNLGELPGTCAHYLVDQDGTVLELVPPTIRCRHTIGLNDVAIGIEMVQEGGSGLSWADRQILSRPAQLSAALALVRSLQAQYGISTSNVIGHGTANGAPQFHDLLGWRNDHVDWQAADVAEFRARL